MKYAEYSFCSCWTVGYPIVTFHLMRECSDFSQSHLNCGISCCHLSLAVWALRLYYHWDFSQAHLNCGLPATDPGCYFHQAPSIDPLKSSPSIATINKDLDLLLVLWGQLWLCPGPTPMRMCPQSPQMLKLKAFASWLQEHSLSIQIFCRQWVYKASHRGVSSLLGQLWAVISAFLS